MGKVYQIQNHFFPFSLEEMKTWDVREPDFRLQMAHDRDRFAAKWLAQRSLSAEALDVMEKGRQLYKAYFAHLHQMITHPLKIESWDAGWYQIRRCLSEHHLASEALAALREAHQRLGQKLLPQIEGLGFLDKDEVFDGLGEHIGAS
jgi:hypothetical protein